MSDWTSEYLQLIEDCEQRESRLTEWDATFLDSIKRQLGAMHQPGRALLVVVSDFDLEVHFAFGGLNRQRRERQRLCLSRVQRFVRAQKLRAGRKCRQQHQRNDAT